MSKARGKQGPDFLVIGAQKAATTWLHQNLSEHPSLWVPPIKELHYFTRCRKKYPGAAIRSLFSTDHHSRAFFQTCGRIMKNSLKRGRYHRFFWIWKYLLRLRTDDRWYFSLFPKDHRIAGEMTPDYLRMTEEDIARLANLLPDLKIILILREPVERFWSHLRMDLRFQKTRISEVSDNEIIRLFHKPCYQQRGDYLTAVKRWQKHFGDARFKVFFYDDIQEDPLEFLGQIYDFLNVDRMIPSAATRVVFTSGDGEPVRPGIARYAAEYYLPQIEELSLDYPQMISWLEKLRSFSEDQSLEQTVKSGEAT